MYCQACVEQDFNAGAEVSVASNAALLKDIDKAVRSIHAAVSARLGMGIVSFLSHALH